MLHMSDLYDLNQLRHLNSESMFYTLKLLKHKPEILTHVLFDAKLQFVIFSTKTVVNKHWPCLMSQENSS